MMAFCVVFLSLISEILLLIFELILSLSSYSLFSLFTRLVRMVSLGVGLADILILLENRDWRCWWSRQGISLDIENSCMEAMLSRLVGMEIRIFCLVRAELCLMDNLFCRVSLFYLFHVVSSLFIRAMLLLFIYNFNLTLAIHFQILYVQRKIRIRTEFRSDEDIECHQKLLKHRRWAAKTDRVIYPQIRRREKKAFPSSIKSSVNSQGLSKPSHWFGRAEDEEVSNLNLQPQCEN